MHRAMLKCTVFAVCTGQGTEQCSDKFEMHCWRTLRTVQCTSVLRVNCAVGSALWMHLKCTVGGLNMSRKVLYVTTHLAVSIMQCSVHCCSAKCTVGAFEMHCWRTQYES